MGYTAASYARMLRQLLPRGKAFEFEPDSTMGKFFQAVADELERIDARAADLIEEVDPRTSTELLDDWERVLDLPDHCIEEIPDTDEGRRLAITQKLTEFVSPTPAAFVALGAACGYEVEVDDSYTSTLAYCGSTSCGDSMYGVSWAHVFKITVSPPAGEALTHDELECLVDRLKPAHTFVFFEYL